jgi:hypothetical protein
MYYLPEDKENIEDAAYIYWSKEENVFLESLQEKEYLLQSLDTPETLLISKDSQKTLSSECQIIINIINELPEDGFLLSGKIKKTKLFHCVKTKTGWSMVKIKQVLDSLTRQLLKLNNDRMYMEASL